MQGVVANVAIRTAVGTTILRQNRLNIPLAGRSTRLTANRLVNIDVSGTGKAAHAHVDFNPWYERQFAIIDESGKWGVYDIEGRQHRDLRIRVDLNVEEYANGSIASEDGTGGGWGRIVWGGDLNSVLACDRKRAGLFDIRVCYYSQGHMVLFNTDSWYRALLQRDQKLLFLLTKPSIKAGYSTFSVVRLWKTMPTMHSYSLRPD